MSARKTEVAGESADYWRHRLSGWLAGREHAATEALDKLKRADCPEPLARRLVDECRSRGWIDDRRCARTRALSLLRRGYGRAHLHRDLAARGIAGELVDEVLRAEDWRERAQQSLRRRFGERPVRPLAAARYLVGKGFDEELAAEVAGLDGDES